MKKVKIVLIEVILMLCVLLVVAPKVEGDELKEEIINSATGTTVDIFTDYDIDYVPGKSVRVSIYTGGTQYPFFGETKYVKLEEATETYKEGKTYISGDLKDKEIDYYEDLQISFAFEWGGIKDSQVDAYLEIRDYKFEFDTYRHTSGIKAIVGDVCIKPSVLQISGRVCC